MQSSPSTLSPSTSFTFRRTPALSPLSSQSIPANPFDSSSGTSSPTRSSHSTNHHRFSFSSAITFSLKNLIRRKPSTVELELEEEKHTCEGELLNLIEPRPMELASLSMAGIDQVLLFGRL